MSLYIRKGGQFGFTTDLSTVGPEWTALIAEQTGMKLVSIMFLEFGFAEETIALIELRGNDTEKFLVGVGESMRGYISNYDGIEREAANNAFLKAIIDHTVSEEE